jgi:hypothetical protein
MVRAGLGKKQDPITKINKGKRASKHKALSSNPSTDKKKKLTIVFYIYSKLITLHLFHHFSLFISLWILSLPNVINELCSHSHH